MTRFDSLDSVTVVCVALPELAEAAVRAAPVPWAWRAVTCILPACRQSLFRNEAQSKAPAVPLDIIVPKRFFYERRAPGAHVCISD